MIFRLFIYLLIFIFSIWLGVLIKQDPGYLLFIIHHWSIEMPLWIGILLLTVFFIGTHFLLNTLYYFFNLKGYFSNWFQRKKTDDAHALITQSLLALTEGHWQDAENLAQKAGKYKNCQLVAYLISARAAHFQNRFDQRDKFLKKAKKIVPQTSIAVTLTQAELQFDSAQYESTLVNAKYLYDQAPANPAVIKLLCRVYEALENWQPLFDLLPDLKKANVLQKAEFDKITETASYQLFCQKQFKTKLALEQTWQTLEKSLQEKPKFIAQYVHWLKYFNTSSEAEIYLKKLLKQNLDNKLLLLYGFTLGDKPSQQLALAERWLQQAPTNPTLLATLGRLAKASEYWGKAKSYFKESLTQKFDLNVAAEYAELLETLNADQEVLAHYRVLKRKIMAEAYK